MAQPSENASGASSALIAMEFLIPQEVEFIEVVDDALFQWEFVNVRDGLAVNIDVDDDDIGDSVENGSDSWESSVSLSMSSDGDDRLVRPDVRVKEDDHLDDAVDDDSGADGGAYGYGYGYGGQQYAHYVDEEEEEEEEDDDDDDDYDLNDELVPWSVSSKFGRQRMRKLGKRAFPKMNRSKRSPCLYLKAGCVRGKHGLGLKHSC